MGLQGTARNRNQSNFEATIHGNPLTPPLAPNFVHAPTYRKGWFQPLGDFTGENLEVFQGFYVGYEYEWGISWNKEPNIFKQRNV